MFIFPPQTYLCTGKPFLDLLWSWNGEKENKSFAPTSRYTTVFTATPKYHTFFRIGFGSVPKIFLKITVKVNGWCACKLWYIFDILWYISEEPGFPWESYMTCDDRYETNRIYLAVNYNFTKMLRVFQKSCQTRDACGALVIRWSSQILQFA